MGTGCLCKGASAVVLGCLICGEGDTSLEPWIGSISDSDVSSFGSSRYASVDRLYVDDSCSPCKVLLPSGSEVDCLRDATRGETGAPFGGEGARVAVCFSDEPRPSSPMDPDASELFLLNKGGSRSLSVPFGSVNRFSERELLRDLASKVP